ncbi:MAG: phosphatase PAP2 family protein [Alphaproteobacteria bacterium]|nr:phosphatase PAP2 family protein [Alphaproteobacteria bacterium]
MKKILLLLCLLAAPAAHATPYFSADTVPPTLIDPPFAADSAGQKADIDAIIQAQAKANPAEVASAREERNMRPELVTLAVNSALTREAYPALYHLLDRVSDTSYVTTQAAKNYWNTKRPYLMDTRVKALIEAHDNPAYPSGHTSGSYSWAHVLAMLLPEKREAFMARAEEIAQHRVLVGMHYHYDLKGGRELALLMVGALTQNAEFQKDLAAAKVELADKRAK